MRPPAPLPAFRAAATLFACLFAPIPAESQTEISFCGGASVCAGQNDKIKNIRVLQQSGARGRWSTDGSLIVFDRVNADGFSDVYLTNAASSFTFSLTENRSGIGQRSNGNAIFHPSDDYVVFISEEEEHFLAFPGVGDSGIGLYSNFWATDLTGSQFWQLNDIPIKQTLFDGIASWASVNPVFSDDGTGFVWTERYAEGGNNNWGLWRLKGAAFSTFRGPSIHDEHVLYQPSTSYVTAMDFITPASLLVAGNLSGQHEYEMDQYIVDFETASITDLTGPDAFWEEGSCISPNHEYIVYMSNRTSSYPLNFDDPDWASQPTEREFWLLSLTGEGQERLTYINDPTAPEYLGGRTIVAECDFSPDGKYLIGTLGYDSSTSDTAVNELKLILIEFDNPYMFAGAAPSISSESVVNAADYTDKLGETSWVTIYGSNLSNTTRTWNADDFINGQLPTSLDGVSVDVGGSPAYVYYISPTQLNMLTPELPEGPVSISVTNNGLTSQSVTAEAAEVVPAFFTYTPDEEIRYVAAVHSDGAIATHSDVFAGDVERHAVPGDIIQIYAIGLGSDDTDLANRLTFWIGGIESVIHYAGLVSPGVFQINVEVPDIPPGDHEVAVDIDGIRNQTAVHIFIDAP